MQRKSYVERLCGAQEARARAVAIRYEFELRYAELRMLVPGFACEGAACCKANNILEHLINLPARIEKEELQRVATRAPRTPRKKSRRPL